MQRTVVRPAARAFAALLHRITVVFSIALGLAGIGSSEVAAQPTITITPAANATLTTRAFTATVTVCATALAGNPTVTFNGGMLPDMFLRTTQSGCTVAGTSTFSLLARPGADTIRAMASDGSHTDTSTRVFNYDDAADVAPVVQALLPVGVYPPTVLAVSSAVADTFTVTNPGPIAAQYTITASCGSFTGCSASPSSVMISAGATARVTANFTTPASTGQSATIQLTASHTSATSHTVSANASDMVSTGSGASPTIIAFTPADGANFVGSLITGSITWCDPDDAMTGHSVLVGGRLVTLTDSTISMSGCDQGHATLSRWTATLQPWDQTVFAVANDAAWHITTATHTIRYSPSLAAFAPQVTPKYTASKVKPAVVDTQTFIVTNGGTYPATYQLAATCGTFLVCTTDKTTMTLTPESIDSVHVTFLAATTLSTFSTLTLVASYTSPAGSSIADMGQVQVRTPTAADRFQPSVDYRHGETVVVAPSGPIQSGYATITNTGTDSATYAIEETATGGYHLYEWVLPPSSVTLGPGESVVIQAEPASPSGNNVRGVITVKASMTADDGTVLSAVDSLIEITSSSVARVAVIPARRTVSVNAGDQPSMIAAFTILNTGDSTEIVTYNVYCRGIATLCPNGTLSQTPLKADTILAGHSLAKGPLLSILGEGQGVVVLEAYATAHNEQASTTSDSTIYTFNGAASRYVQVVPKSPLVDSVGVGDSTIKVFMMTNLGGDTTSYHYAASCTGSVFASCDSLHATGYAYGLGVNQSAAVSVKYRVSTTAGQTGTLKFVAYDVHDNTVRDSAMITIVSATVPTLAVDVDSVGVTATIARDQCVSLPAGEAAASECGDLRLVHALPSTTTYNATRTPVLLYNSRHQTGVVLLPANVRIRPGATVTSIKATVTINSHIDSVRFVWDTSWSKRGAFRIVVPFHARPAGLGTGAYHYDLTIDAGNSITAQASGTVAIVNRGTSQFGPGWWLDGLEQLITVDATHKLWVGADGSTRYFTRQTDTTLWLVARTLDRVDSLTRSGSTWVRHLRNGTQMQFDNSGLHTATIDALGRVTQFFSHGDPSQLDSILLPSPSGTRRLYRFTHDGTTGYLTLVDAPSNPYGLARRDTVKYTTSGSGGLVSAITDPDGHGASFGYTTDHITSRTNRRGYTTTFGYDNALGLSSSSIPASPQSLDITFCASETASLNACNAGPTDTASVVTLVQGPGQDAAHQTQIKVNRYGAATHIVDAMGNSSTILRGDSRWPFLVTGTIDPRGATTTTNYDGRGLPISVTQNSFLLLPGQAGLSRSRTQLAWDLKWDLPVLVTSPTGLQTHSVYDSTTGNVTTVSEGNGNTHSTYTFDGTPRNIVDMNIRELRYTYDATSKLLTSVVSNADSVMLLPSYWHADTTAFTYDTLGNVATTTDWRGLTRTVTRDYLGRDSVAKSPITAAAPWRWRYQTLTYDTLGRVIEAADSAQVSATDTTWQSVHVTTRFDLNSNVLSVTRSPYPSGVTGTIADSADYDSLDRPLHRYDPNKSGDKTLATVLYDVIGNVAKITRGTGTDTIGYDVLGRPTYRKVSGVTNSYTPGASSDEQRFFYDAAGNLDSATNKYAKVHRTYTLGGLLASETQEIANADLTFGTHSYTLGYSYDLDGRRTALSTPSTLTSLGSSLTYGYDPASGDLSTITSSALGTFTFANWLSGKPQFYIKPDNSVEIFQYAAPSFQRQELHLANPTWPLSHNDTYYLDGRGKTTSLTSITFGTTTTPSFAYTGLGSVLSSGAGFQTEDYLRDPLGNAIRKSVGAPTWSSTDTLVYQPHSTRVSSIVGSPSMTGASWTTALDSLIAVTYDQVGNLTRRDERVIVPTTCGSRAPCDPPQPDHTAASHLYNDFSADGKLLKSELVTTNDTYNGVDSTNVFPYAAIGRGVLEEYRYDALGRRVWLRAHREPYCTNVTDLSDNPICLSAIERFVYDGDQVLFEIRQLGRDSATASVLENDAASDTDNPDQFGIVAYLHGLSIDQPLALVRSRPAGNTALILHRDWQGAVDFGTIPSGASQGKPIDCGRPDAVIGCEHIPWPGIDLSIGFQRPVTDIGQYNWWGTLVAGNQNATGLVDMRARQFDPKLGQFVQEDPMGISGGINTYAFGGGDAVNMRDPSGTTPCTKSTVHVYEPGTSIDLWFTDFDCTEATAFDPSSEHWHGAWGAVANGVADFWVGVGHGATFGLLASDYQPMGSGAAFKIGDFVGQAAISEIVPAIAADVAFVGPATRSPVVKGLFGRTKAQGVKGLLNGNDYLRTGFGWKGSATQGTDVFRSSGKVIDWLLGQPRAHIDWIVY